jgi:hypothetical protein
MNPASAKTSLNQVPALHKFTSSLGLSVFDFGAGKKGKIDEFYASQHLPRVYLPFDPFNRDKEENTKSWKYLEDEGVDIVTCANVLNVLEDENLDPVIFNLAAATRQTFKGICFVSVYHNRRLPKNRKVGDHFQRNEPIGWYVPHLSRVFSSVDRLGQFLACKA